MHPSRWKLNAPNVPAGDGRFLRQVVLAAMRDSEWEVDDDTPTGQMRFFEAPGGPVLTCDLPSLLEDRDLRERLSRQLDAPVHLVTGEGEAPTGEPAFCLGVRHDASNLMGAAEILNGRGTSLTVRVQVRRGVVDDLVLTFEGATAMLDPRRIVALGHGATQVPVSIEVSPEQWTLRADAKGLRFPRGVGFEVDFQYRRFGRGELRMRATPGDGRGPPLELRVDVDNPTPEAVARETEAELGDTTRSASTLRWLASRYDALERQGFDVDELDRLRAESGVPVPDRGVR